MAIHNHYLFNSNDRRQRSNTPELEAKGTYQQRLVEGGLAVVLLHGSLAVGADIQRQLKGAGRFGRLGRSILRSSHVLGVLALAAT